MDDGGKSARSAWRLSLYATQPEHVAPPQTHPANDSLRYFISTHLQLLALHA
ncbi:hypothetical protein C8F01DRAFT_1262399 [Mycena amicta]|nr:hypothetical protein C8F01DRAFT_1262399 [Mycena amicta]